MTTDPRLMMVMQWLSPAFPTGAFAYSHGLETAIASGELRTASDVEQWLRGVLLVGSGRSDAIFVRLAYNAARSELAHLDAEARAFAPAMERAREAARQGAAFAHTMREVWALDVPDALLPVASGRAARCARVELEAFVSLYLLAFAANIVSAAVRAVPLGQIEGQAVVARLATDCAEVAAETKNAGIDDIASTAFISDIAAMRHEIVEPRLFQS